MTSLWWFRVARQFIRQLANCRWNRRLQLNLRPPEVNDHCYGLEYRWDCACPHLQGRNNWCNFKTGKVVLMFVSKQKDEKSEHVWCLLAHLLVNLYTCFLGLQFSFNKILTIPIAFGRVHQKRKKKHWKWKNSICRPYNIKFVFSLFWIFKRL